MPLVVHVPARSKQCLTAYGYAISKAVAKFNNIATCASRGRNLSISVSFLTVRQQQKATTSMELEHEAYETPVATLIDLWVTRFGNEWVDLETIDNDEFFSKACKRLKQMGQLEMHYLTDRARYVCRKPK